MKEALFYFKENHGLRCMLCPNRCLIGEEERGICGIRINKKGKLYARGYGLVSSIALDPMEKKPLYHFYPGNMILSIGGLGCNLRCSFCQNWEIAHGQRDTKYISPERLIEMAISRGSVGLAFTYNEPIINYEYIKDTAILARAHGLKMVLVTNGFIELEPLERILPYIDAMNIDVKAFSQKYYRKICGGSLSPIKRSVELAAQHTHVEITTLVVGGLNDNQDDMNMLFKWIQGVNPSIPLHLSRYYPNYNLTLPATPTKTILKIKNLALNYLPYVYIGNVGGIDNNTYCPTCKSLIVKRDLLNSHIEGINLGGRCIECQATIPIVID